MRIFAFRGTRYAGDPAHTGQLGAPPFDQVDSTLRDRFYDQSPHHFVRLTRPTTPDDSDIYRHADALHRSWLEDGTIASDPEPALYPYSIHLVQGGRRLGLCALVGVEDASSDVIRPHEQTLDKPFADRLNLLRETRVDLEPVMFLSDDPGTLEALLEEDLAKKAPIVVHEDTSGNIHRLYRLTEAERIRAYQEVLTPCSAAIADGHHRYKVGRTYAEQSGAEAGTAAGAKMAVLFSLASENLVIDPIHRGLKKVPDLEELRRLLSSYKAFEASSGAEVAATVAAAPAPAMAVATHDGTLELWQLDPQRMPEGAPPGAEQLAVSHLHQVHLPAVGFNPESYLDGTVNYRADPEVLWQQLRSGELACGFFLPPMTAESFGLAISKGDLLPAKSTRFLPKLASGLVWSRHETQIC